MKRLIIAGTHSGCGKTTVTCAVLAALKARGMRVSAFKCGPDYIDPMFHREVIGVPSHNLDSFFCSGDTLRYLLYENSRDSGIAVIEGVMGFYDGAEGRGSAHSVSCITETHAVIVIDCRGMSDSIGAVMRGFLEYRRPNRIAGFIFNRLPERLVPLAKRLCGELGTRYLGCMPKSGIVLESRSLGLVTAAEIPDIKAKLAALGELAEKGGAGQRTDGIYGSGSDKDHRQISGDRRRERQRVLLYLCRQHRTAGTYGLHRKVLLAHG